MIRRWLISIIIICFAAVGAVVWQRHARTVPWDECSEVYRQYAHADGIEATFVHDYPVCDTLSVDVTILQATDSAGWDTLYKKNNLTLHHHSSDDNPIEKGEDVLELWNDKENNILSVASHRDHYICHFHTDNQQFKDAISGAIQSTAFKSIKTNDKFYHDEKKD